MRILWRILTQYPDPESNWELSFRRALLYPFNYQGNKKCCKGSHFLRKMTTFALEFHKNNQKIWEN